jgi:hypothetical protein
MATKINLRKANAIQRNIQDLMSSIEIHTTININEFQDPNAALEDGANKLLSADVRRSDLLMALYTIRSLVGNANASCGVDTRLSHGAYVDKRIAQLEPLVKSTTERGDSVVLAGKLEKIKSRPADSRHSIYGMHDEVSSGVLTKEAIDSIRVVIAEMKKQKQTINDEVLELNIRTEIELTPDVEVVLQREGVI